MERPLCEYLTVQQAAQLLNIDKSQVVRYCQRGVLKATKHGRDWWIHPADLREFAHHKPKRGRPRKER